MRDERGSRLQQYITRWDRHGIHCCLRELACLLCHSYRPLGRRLFGLSRSVMVVVFLLVPGTTTGSGGEKIERLLFVVLFVCVYVYCCMGVSSSSRRRCTTLFTCCIFMFPCSSLERELGSLFSLICACVVYDSQQQCFRPALL